jgi:hypothetical protein
MTGAIRLIDAEPGAQHRPVVRGQASEARTGLDALHDRPGERVTSVHIGQADAQIGLHGERRPRWWTLPPVARLAYFSRLK